MQSQTYCAGALRSGGQRLASDAAREYARHLARQDRRISYREGGNGSFVDAVNAVVAESSAGSIAFFRPESSSRQTRSRALLRGGREPGNVLDLQ